MQNDKHHRLAKGKEQHEYRKQGRIHGHQLRTGGQGRKFAFSQLDHYRRTNRRTDKSSYRDAWTHLKTFWAPYIVSASIHSILLFICWGKMLWVEKKRHWIIEGVRFLSFYNQELQINIFAPSFSSLLSPSLSFLLTSCDLESLADSSDPSQCWPRFW